LIKADEDLNVFVYYISRIVARIKCENECRGLYRIIEAADWFCVEKWQ